MIRMPAPGRFEDRTVDGSCNPYLAATVVLAAGLDGVENKIDPGEPNRDNLYEVPAERSAGGASAPPRQPARRHPQPGRGRRPPQGARRDRRGDYIDYFVQVKQTEWNEYHEQVSDWETKRYLGLF